MMVFIIFIPVGAIIHIIVPKSKVNPIQSIGVGFIISFFSSFCLFQVGKFMCLPCIKFITFTFSYLGFIVLLVLSSLRIVNNDLGEGSFKQMYNDSYEKYLVYYEKNLTYKFPTKDFYIRTTQPNSIDLAICIWLLGKISLYLYRKAAASPHFIFMIIKV